MNRISPSTTRKPNGKVKDLKNGSIVRWGGGFYVVLLYMANASQIGAVSLQDGGYLTPDTVVEIVPAGDVLTLTVGE
jgi:hypothetical protein